MGQQWRFVGGWLLLRDCLLFEDGDRLVLFGGVPPTWFRDAEGMEIVNAPTYFGACSLKYSYDGKKNERTLEIGGSARPAGGFVLRVPLGSDARVLIEGREIRRQDNGDFFLPAETTKASIVF